LILGRVVGNVWATKKDDKLVGTKLLIVKQLDLELKEKEDFLVAVDNVGAGEGDIVLVTMGSSSRQTEYTDNKPVDAVIIAIVDKLDVSKKTSE
jgi:ethanolamine utilization protein EutN